MSLGSRLFAARYDSMIKGAEEAGLKTVREELLSGVSGRVVEIGAGTGRNLAFYGDGVELTLTEPDPHMARRLEQRLGEHRARWSSCRLRQRAFPSRTDSSMSPSRHSSSAASRTRPARSARYAGC